MVVNYGAHRREHRKHVKARTSFLNFIFFVRCILLQTAGATTVADRSDLLATVQLDKTQHIHGRELI